MEKIKNAEGIELQPTEKAWQLFAADIIKHNRAAIDEELAAMGYTPAEFESMSAADYERVANKLAQRLYCRFFTN